MTDYSNSFAIVRAVCPDCGETWESTSKGNRINVGRAVKKALSAHPSKTCLQGARLTTIKTGKDKGE